MSTIPPITDNSQQPAITADDPRVAQVLALIKARAAQAQSVPLDTSAVPSTATIPQAPTPPLPTQLGGPSPAQQAAPNIGNPSPTPNLAAMSPQAPQIAQPPSANVAPTPPPAQPGPIKSFLQSLVGGLGNAAYAGTQGALQRLGLPTDYEKQQNAAKLAIQQQAANDTSQYRQALTDLTQGKSAQLDAQNTPYTFGTGSDVPAQLRGQTFPTIVATALQRALGVQQLKGNTAEDVANTAANSRIGVATIGANAKEDLGKVALEYRQAIADRNYGVARARLGILQAGFGLRSQALQAALYGTDAQGNALPGAAQIGDENGNLTTVGSRFAPTAVKQQKTVATFNDLSGSVKNLRSAITNYQKEGGNLNDPVLAAAASDPTSTVGKVINGQLVTGGLTPTELTLLNAQRQTMEQAGILRSTTGGTASEAGAQRILATVPQFGQDTNASALSKLDEQEQVLKRLSAGQTKVSGGVSVSGRPAPATAPTGTPVAHPFFSQFGGQAKP